MKPRSSKKSILCTVTALCTILCMVGCSSDTASSKPEDEPCPLGSKTTPTGCKEVQCGIDKIYDDKQGECICNEEKHWINDENDGCKCADNYELNNQKTACNPKCGEGQIYSDIDAACICAPGFSKNAQGECFLTNCSKHQIYDEHEHECTCDLQNHWLKGEDEGACVCDESNHWIEDQDSCVCDENNHWIEDQGTCKCDENNHWMEDHGTCVCENGYKLDKGECVLQCGKGEIRNFLGLCECDIENHWTGDTNHCTCAPCYELDPTETQCIPKKCGKGEKCDPNDSECKCDAGNHWIPSDQESVCKCDDEYEEIDTPSGGKACKSTRCESVREVYEDGACKCDDARNWTGESGHCECKKRYAMNIDENACSLIQCDPIKEKYNSEETGCICKTEDLFEGDPGNCQCIADYEYDPTEPGCIPLVCNRPGEIKNPSRTGCMCDPSHHWTGSPGSCNCDTGYKKNDAGTACIPDCGDKKVASGYQCICDAEHHWVSDGTPDGCMCAEPFHINATGDKCLCSHQLKRTDGTALRKGDTIKFGSFYQSNSTSKEDIVWRVLDVDDNNCRLLLLSDKSLYRMEPYVDRQNTPWKDSSGRQWMNNEFYSSAFNETQKSHVLQLKVPESHCPGSDDKSDETVDRLFLLGYEEVEKYFTNTNKSERKAEITEYAKTTGEFFTDQTSCERNFVMSCYEKCASGNSCGNWCHWCSSSGIVYNTWRLRTESPSGSLVINATDGDYFQGYKGNSMCIGEHGIRPAFWYDNSFK